jgi:hypothetical protein
MNNRANSDQGTATFVKVQSFFAVREPTLDSEDRAGSARNDSPFATTGQRLGFTFVD